MMTQLDALKVLADHRGDRVVISSMGSVGLWASLSDIPADFAYLPSSMGQAVPLALGLALARPMVGFVVLTGDGSLVMNLGCLAAVAENPADLTVVVIENGVYEVTGGQPVVGAGRVDFATVARGLGIRRSYAFDDLDDWSAGCGECPDGPGPRFIALKVRGETGKRTPPPPHPMAGQIARLRARLGVS